MSTPAANPAMMKAMSHPLRWRIIAVVNGLGHARATDISTELGEPVNSISFHLRTLADVGILVEAPELARDARERVWKLGRPDINADLGLLKDDAAYRTATAASLGLIHSEVQQAIIEAMADGSETLAHSEATSLQLTRHQARALAARLHGIVQEFEEDPEAASAGVDTQEDPSERSAAIYTGLVALAPLRRRPDAHQ